MKGEKQKTFRETKQTCVEKDLNRKVLGMKSQNAVTV